MLFRDFFCSPCRQGAWKCSSHVFEACGVMLAWRHAFAFIYIQRSALNYLFLALNCYSARLATQFTHPLWTFFLNNIATAVFMGPHSCAQVCAWADECRLSSKTWTKLSDFPLWECIKRTFFCCCCLFLRFLLVNLWFVRGACSYVLCLASILCVVFPLMCYVTRARMIRTKCMPLWCLTHLRRAYALSLRHTLSVIRTLRCAPFSCHLKQR